MDAIGGRSARDSQTAWLFRAAAAASFGYVIAIVVAQVARLSDVSGSRIPALSLVLGFIGAVALVAASKAVPPKVRTVLGSATAGFMAGLVMAGLPASLVLLPAVALLGAGAAVAFEGLPNGSPRALSVAAVVIGFAVGVLGVVR